MEGEGCLNTWEGVMRNFLIVSYSNSSKCCLFFPLALGIMRQMTDACNAN